MPAFDNLISPSVLGIVEVEDSISVISVIGLAFLLFLAGLEIEFDKAQGPRAAPDPDRRDHGYVAGGPGSSGSSDSS